MLRVLVDAVSAQLGGGATHALAQLEELDRFEDLELTVHAVGGVADELKHLCPRARVVRHSRRPLPLRLLWEQAVLTTVARGHDVIYSIGNFALLAAPCPQVLCAQNAIYFTDEVRKLRRCLWSPQGRARLKVESLFARISIRRAERVVVVSDAMRRAIYADLGAELSVSVVRSAAPALPPPKRHSTDPRPGSYLLSVAHDDPHKDWDGLVRGVLADPSLGRMVLVGRCTRARAQTIEARGRGRISVLGPVHDRSRLAALYAGARCVVAHSLVESFGLTVGEAQTAGVPVAAAELAAHREIATVSTQFYPVGNSQALAAAVTAAVKQGASNRPASRGIRSWRDNATELAAILREVAAGA